MGVTLENNLLISRGKANLVDKISVHDISLLSKYSVKSYRLRYVNESNKSIHHSTPRMHIFYPEGSTIELITEDNYHIVLTPDVEVWTMDGWKKAGDVQVDERIWVNGSDVPPYQDKEVLRKLYYDDHLTQAQIAEKLGCKPRTIRLWVHRFGLEKGIAGKSFGDSNGRWTGDNVSTKGGYERTYEKYYMLKTGICSRCGRTLPTQLHHDDRDTTNTTGDNIIELCDLCHAMEHHGYVVQWVRPARITDIRMGGMHKTYGIKLFDAENVVIEGFILRFKTDNAQTKEFDR